MTAGSRGPAFPVGPIALALWFGSAGGLAESALVAIKRYGLHHYTRLSFQNLWTAPIAVACLLLVPALAVWALARWRPRLPWWQGTVTAFAFVAAFNVLLNSYALHPLARLILALGVGVATGRLAAAHPDAARALVRRTLPLQAGLVALIGLTLNTAVAVRERRALAALGAPDQAAPNVLLLILDTVRALDLSVYGYLRPTTPNLARLAAQGVSFEHAISPSPWTLPAHAAIFTGRDASELSANWHTPLDDRFPTLAEAYRDRGYATAGFAANLVYTTDESGLARGFAHYDAVRVTPGSIAFSAKITQFLLENETVRSVTGFRDLLWRRSANDMRSAAADWLAAHRGRPYFAFVNFYDAHNPYLPPPPFDTLFAPPVPWSARNLWVHQSAPVTAAAAQVERDAYDRALAYLDHEIGAMLSDLEARGLLHNTIVVVTSDHGEEFGEHGLLGHGNSLHLQSLHVPLLLQWRGRIPEGRRVAQTVAVRDAAATILDLTGAGSFAGRSLRGLWDDAVGAPGPEPVRAEVRHATGLPAWFPVSKGDMASLVSDRYQLIRDGEGAETAFDLGLDPTGALPYRGAAELLAGLRALLPPQRR